MVPLLVLDPHRVDTVGNPPGLERAVEHHVRRDHAAEPALPHEVPRATELELDDVPHGLTRVAGRPGLNGTLEHAP